MMSDATTPIMLSDSLDTLLMQMADLNARVTGTYYGNTFAGTAFLSRQDANYRERLYIKLDKPTLIKVSPNDSGRIAEILIVGARDIEADVHTLKWERVAK